MKLGERNFWRWREKIASKIWHRCFSRNLTNTVTFASLSGGHDNKRIHTSIRSVTFIENFRFTERTACSKRTSFVYWNLTRKLRKTSSLYSMRVRKFIKLLKSYYNIKLYFKIVYGESMIKQIRLFSEISCM